MINIKKQKEKFLEDYFSLCREHGYCIDSDDSGWLLVSDWPQYINSYEWEDIKIMLKDSING